MLLSLSIYFEFFLSKSTDEIQAELYMPIFTNNYYSDGYIELKKKRLASKGCNDRFRIFGGGTHQCDLNRDTPNYSPIHDQHTKCYFSEKAKKEQKEETRRIN